MKNALVIRYGDPETANAIAQGMETAQQLSRNELAMVKAELQRMQIVQAKLDVRAARDEKYYKRKIARARRKYGNPPRGNIVTNTLWGVYGLAVEVVGSWLDSITT